MARRLSDALVRRVVNWIATDLEISIPKKIERGQTPYAPKAAIAELIRQAYAERESKVQELCDLLIAFDGELGVIEPNREEMGRMIELARSLREEG